MTSSGSPLRLVVLLRSSRVPAWMRQALARVAESGTSELVLAVTSGIAPPRWPLPFRLYEALDGRRFRGVRDPEELVDVSDLLGDCPRARAELAATSGRWSLSPGTTKQIASSEPDVILNLGLPPLTGELPGIARYGVWSFDHEDARWRGRPPFFWEILRGCPVSETTLQAVTGTGLHVLQQSYAATDGISLRRGRSAALWKTAAFLERALRSPDAVAPAPVLPQPSLEAPQRAPRLLELARFGARAGWAVLRERLRRRREDFLWFIAVRRARGSWVDGDLAGFRPLVPPPGHFQADPFLVQDDGCTWLFYEEAKLPDGRGWLCCRELLPDGTPGEARTVLARDAHLSYPFVFRHADEWYMVPETRASGTVELWRASAFPWEWKLERVLLDGVEAVDTSLLEHGGRFWLFTSISAPGGARNDELLLFSADSLDGVWTPHPANPIVSDVRRARSAGRLFREGGQLYRPAQDCSGEYGSGIWIHRVEQLDGECYREVPVRRIDSDWWPGGRCTHTIDRAGDLEVIDGRAWFAAGTQPKP